MFEKVTNIDLEILADDEISAMIEELKNEKEKRWNFKQINAIDEIIEVIDKNIELFGSAILTLRNGSDFYIGDFVVALMRYRREISEES